MFVGRGGGRGRGRGRGGFFFLIFGNIVDYFLFFFGVFPLASNHNVLMNGSGESTKNIVIVYKNTHTLLVNAALYTVHTV